MASSYFVSDNDHSEEDGPVKLVDAGWHIEVYETNYQIRKRFPVHGKQSIGQLIVVIVKEIGKDHLF